MLLFRSQRSLAMKKTLALLFSLIFALMCPSINSASTVNALSVSAPGVEPCDTGLELCPSSMILPMFSSSSGERLRVKYDGEIISASFFTWSSSDPSVLTVDQSGNIRAISPGTAVVSASDGEEYAESFITVVADEDFNTLADLEPIDLSFPFYSDHVGIGPLCGAEPVILKRFVKPPSCGDQPEPDPNAFIASEGWTYSYAVIYKFHASYGQTIRFETSQSTVSGPHASNACVCLYDCYFYLWDYSGGTSQNPYGSVTLESYEDGIFYVVITPGNHTLDSNSGNICFTAYDVNSPFILGDVNADGTVDFSDASTLAAYLMTGNGISQDYFSSADANRDGSVSIADITAIYSIIFGD